jgi:PPOX class probable F420-dependent enzyme
MEIDTSTSFGKHVLKRLQEEQILWLTTLRADLTPQPVPVWFIWNGADLLVFSQPQAQKVRNLREHTRVALNFNGTFGGSDIVVLWGEARIVDQPVPEDELKAYLEKYAQGLKEIQMTVDEFTKSYGVAIRITPMHLSGHSD